MTTSILLVIVALLAVGEFLLFGALAESYRDIRQLREYFGMIDKPAPIDLGASRDKIPSHSGMHPELDSAAHAVVVYLESRCGTCRSIVSSLNGGIPNGMWLIIIAESADAAFEWLAEAQIAKDSVSAGRVMVASAQEVEHHLGVRVTPLAIEIENGRLARAKTVPSVRQFYAMVPITLSLASPIQQGAPA